jgi:hypothetical protein
MQFFELSQPCPNEIQDCEKHRLSYVNEIDILKKAGRCTACVERTVRNRYINILQLCLKK